MRRLLAVVSCCFVAAPCAALAEEPLRLQIQPERLPKIESSLQFAVPPASSPVAVPIKTVGESSPLPILMLVGEKPDDEPAQPASASEPLKMLRKIAPAAETVSLSSRSALQDPASVKELSPEYLKTRPLRDVSTNIRPPSGDLPPDYAGQIVQKQGGLNISPASRVDPIAMNYAWTAPAVCHGALLFEDVNLERYGHSVGMLQPAVSAAHFFGTLPALPYLVVAERPCQCTYTLGHRRPGSRVPHQHHWPPPSTMGGLVEAATIAGAIIIIP